MKKYLILFLAIILFSGCNNNCGNTEFEKNLVIGNENELWCFEALENGEYILVGYHKFYCDKTYDSYNNEMRSLENISLEGEVYKKINWFFNEKEKLFSLGSRGLTYNLVGYSKDTILLEGYGYKGNFRMVRTVLKQPQ